MFMLEEEVWMLLKIEQAIFQARYVGQTRMGSLESQM
jgi:hypothetical protein